MILPNEEGQMAEERVRTTLNLPAALVRQVKHWCVDHDADFQDCVAEGLRLFLKQKGGR